MEIKVFAGDVLNLKAFGIATVTQLRVHKETGELVANVKAKSGELLYLSLAYCEKVKV